MLRWVLVFSVLTIGLVEAQCQIVFEEGYFIDNSQNRVNCLIKNKGWRDNPNEFKYKAIGSPVVQIGVVENIKEFGVNGKSKYLRSTVDIDRSSNDPNKLDTNRKPAFKKEVLFLKVLVEGDLSLMKYRKGTLIRYFYKTQNSETVQLVQKSYKVNGKIGENNLFRTQIKNILSCDEGLNTRNLRYTNSELIKVFIAQNKCTNTDYIDYQIKKNKDLISLSIRPGLYAGSLNVFSFSNANTMVDLGGEIGYRLGVELEYVLPYNKSKLALIVEPTYQVYKSKKSEINGSISGGVLISEIDYSSVEVPIGFRYYSFMGEDSRLFFDATINVDFNGGSTIQFLREDRSVVNSFKLQSKANFGFGIGYNRNNKYSLEIRYHTTRDLLNNIALWKSKFSNLSLIFGYRL